MTGETSATVTGDPEGTDDPEGSRNADGDDPSYRWLGHGTIFLPGPPQFVVDPWRWRDVGLAADVALLTHDTIDHCSPGDLREALANEGVIVAPERAARELGSEFAERVRVVCEGDQLTFGDCVVHVLPAEGPRRGGAGSGFLPRGRGVAYALRRGGETLLVLGDSTVLPEHAALTPDLAFFAVGGLLTASPEEAARGAATLSPGLAVPVHWGDLEARHDAARRFVSLCGEHGVRAEVPLPGGTRAGRPTPG